MGPVSRYLGPWVAEPQLWQDPVPAVDHELVGARALRGPQEQDRSSGLSIFRLVCDRVGSRRSSFRGTDKRGGAPTGTRPPEPQRGWAVNEPAELGKVAKTLKLQQEN